MVKLLFKKQFLVLLGNVPTYSKRRKICMER